MPSARSRHLGLWNRLCVGLCVGFSIGAMLGAPGCRVIRYYFPAEDIEIAPGQAIQKGAAQGGGTAPAPMNSSATRGLEVRLWVVDDTQRSAPRWLTPYIGTDEESQSHGTSPNPISAETIAGWSDWGFRVITIPIGEVDGFLDALRPVQPINVQWLGEFGQWRAIVRAGELGNDRVRVGSGSREIERGRPRLIARSWVEPILAEDDVVPGVRVDLGLQIETSESRARRRRETGFFEPDQERSIEDNGPVLDELLLSAMLDGSQAIVIVGEAPGVDWHELPDYGAVSDPDDSSKPDDGSFGPRRTEDGEDFRSSKGMPTGSESSVSDPEEQVGRHRAQSSGPTKPMGTTLGELMLTSPGSRMSRANQSRSVPKRVIIVLIPRVQGGYSLFPRAGGANP